jgi:hypothetical protein
MSIRDVLLGDGGHHVAFTLQARDAQLRLRPLRDEERHRAEQIPNAPARFGALVAELGPEGAPRAVVLFDPSLRLELIERPYSPGYGERIDALALRVQRGLNAPGHLGWVVLWW